VARDFFLSQGSRLALEHNLLPIHGILQRFDLEVKRPERETDHSPPSISKVDSVWDTIPLPHSFNPYT